MPQQCPSLRGRHPPAIRLLRGIHIERLSRGWRGRTRPCPLHRRIPALPKPRWTCNLAALGPRLRLALHPSPFRTRRKRPWRTWLRLCKAARHPGLGGLRLPQPTAGLGALLRLQFRLGGHSCRPGHQGSPSRAGRLRRSLLTSGPPCWTAWKRAAERQQHSSYRRKRSRRRPRCGRRRHSPRHPALIPSQ